MTTFKIRYNARTTLTSQQPSQQKRLFFLTFTFWPIHCLCVQVIPDYIYLGMRGLWFLYKHFRKQGHLNRQCTEVANIQVDILGGICLNLEQLRADFSPIKDTVVLILPSSVPHKLRMISFFSLSVDPAWCSG